MNGLLKSPEAFAALAIILPALCALMAVVWLMRRGLI
jgi:hypothetical protein